MIDGRFTGPDTSIGCVSCGYERDKNGVEYLRVDALHRIAFERARVLYPALDSNPTETLILTIPLKSDIKTLKKERWDRKGEHVVNEYEETKDMALYTITDHREIFPCAREEFHKRNWLAKIPEPMIAQRWSPAGETGVSSFLMKKAPKVDARELYEEIRSRFDYYCDLNSPFIEGAHDVNCAACAVYVLLTYFFFMFEYVPYLKAGGVHGSGKSKWGRLFLAMAFNARTSADIRKTVVYRTVQDTRGCLLIDEAETLSTQNEVNQELISVLNSGWEKIGKVPLVDKETMRVTEWSTFGPKVIMGINPVYEVLADRTFSIPFFKTLDRAKGEREPDPEADEWWSIRDRLYLLLMQNWHQVKDLAKSTTNSFGFNGRLWNLAKPMIVMARFVDGTSGPEEAKSAEKQILSFLENQAKQKQENVDQSLAGSVLTALDQFLSQESLVEDDAYRFAFSVKDIAEKVCDIEGIDPKKSRPKKIAAVLTNLGLYRNPRRSGKTGSFVFDVSKADVKDVRTRLAVSSTAASAPTAASPGDPPPPSAGGPTSAPGPSKSTEGAEHPELTEGGLEGRVEKREIENKGSLTEDSSGRIGVSKTPSVRSVGSVSSVAKSQLSRIYCSVEGCGIRLGASPTKEEPKAELSIYKLEGKCYCRAHYLEKAKQGKEAKGD